MRLREGVVARVRFNADGFVPAVAQDVVSRQMLTSAWMDGEALTHAPTNGWATYWPRNHQIYWIKRKVSDNHQRVVSVHLDCDGDTVLLRVEQAGAACRTGNPTCFLTGSTGSDVEY